MEVSDAFFRVHHGQRGAGGEGGLEIGFDGGLLIGGEFLDFGHQIAEAVVEIHTEPREHRGMFFKEITKKNLHRMAEKNGVRDLHHGGFEVEGEKNAQILRGGNLSCEEGFKRFAAHEGGVDDFAGLEFETVLEHRGRTPGGSELDFRRGGGWQGHGFFIREKVVAAHGGNPCFGIRRPCAHLVRVFAGVVLHCLRRAAVGIALTQDRIHGAALDLVVAGLGVLLVVVCGHLGIVRQGETALLQLRDGGFELGDGCADIGKLDDVCLGLERESAEFGKGIFCFLICRQPVRKNGQNTPRQRNVPHLHRDARMLREALQDRQEGVSGQKRGFVGLRVDDGRLGRHMGKSSI